MQTDTLANDLGTSNSAAAICYEHGIHRIPIETGAETLPTAVFFPVDGTGMRIGAAATDALIQGEEGRYMRALKSVLGQPLMHEERLLGGRRRSISGVISDFLSEVRRRAEQYTGKRFHRALSGRPVHFFSARPDKDEQAEDDLRACYLAAGFEDVSFLPEPEAAALANHALGSDRQIGLIVDIGGGTSDFSVFRSTAARPQILANYGIRLGGTDFDHAISMSHVMPLLGLGGQLRREIGAGLLPVPRALYVDLATWAKIPFLYAPETLRQAAAMARVAVDPEAIQRLVAVLELQLGHELAFAVERGKIEANAGVEAGAVQMGFIEKGLAQAVTSDSLEAALTEKRQLLKDAMIETLSMADVRPDDIGRVILVGGSSLMGFVTAEARALCPTAEILQSEAFTAVVDGLALASHH